QPLICFSRVSSSWLIAKCQLLSATPLLLYFFFPFAFLPAAFLAFGLLFVPAPFLAAALAACASPSACVGLAFFLRAGSSGAAYFWPSKAISVMRTAVNGWRWPKIFLYCFLRLKW